MTELHSLAIRFADLWAVDEHLMVEEVYAPDIHMESMARLAEAAVDGSDQLHAVEDRLAAMIPEHRHELVRVVAEEGLACLETTVVSPTTGEFAPVCLWWRTDHRGQVANEIGWFDWPNRSGESRRSHGLVPPNDHRARGDRRWYLAFVDALAHGLIAGPAATLQRVLAPDCIAELVGMAACDNVEAAVRPLQWIDVHEVAADGAVIAVLFTGGDGERVSRGTVVLTLDPSDRVLSLRVYWRWSSAVSVDAVHPSVHLGLAR